MPTELLMLIGAGGHARVVLDALRVASPGLRVCIMDNNPALNGTNFADLVVRAPVDWKGDRAGFHISIGANDARQRCFGEALQHGWKPISVIHPAAIISTHALVGPGSFLAAGAIVAPAARLGSGVIVNHGAVVDHNCSVGDFCHVAPQAALGGGVLLKRCVFIGAGATILPGLTIGDNAIIGAGAVVIHDVAAGQTVTGVPARLHPAK